MRHFIAAFFAFALALGISIPDAEARRLGGGGSSGMQRQITPPAPRQPSAAPQQAPQQGAAAAAQPRRSWMGPVAGLAAGLGLAALFSHLGLGEELASFVMLALLAIAAIMLVRFFMRRSKTSSQAAASMQYAAATNAAGGRPNDWGAAPAPAARTVMPPPAGVAPADEHRFPPGFDAEGFARQAKVNFIRLQAANDSANLDDIREFTTPEMFAEIRMQLTERGSAPQRTDVVELDAEVLEVIEEANRYVVSVRFSGLLREEADAAPAPFDEVWHLTKLREGGGWVVAGIQQIS